MSLGMIDRRKFLLGAPLSAFIAETLSTDVMSSEKLPTLKDAARRRGIEVGAFANLEQLQNPAFAKMISENFTLAAILFEEMEWDANPGFDSEPSFAGLTRYLDMCQTLGLRTRARQIYSAEALPSNAHLRSDGTPKNKSELEKTLLKRVEQVCRPLRGRNAIIQVIDEILADHEGGLRQDPFSKILGEEYVDILFHAAHEAAPDALLTYQEFGPENNPDDYFKKKTKDYLALLGRLRKRNVPITGAALGGFTIPPWGLHLKKSIFKAIQDLEYDVHLNELTIIYSIRGDPYKWYPKNSKENDRVVREHYSRTVRFLCQLKRLREITFWAPVDGDNTVQTGTLGIEPYAKARPGIFNRDLTPKPVYRDVTAAVMKSTPIL